MNANKNFFQCSYRATLNNRFFNEIFKQGYMKKSVEKKMDEAKAINKITVNLPKVKVEFINDTH